MKLLSYSFFEREDVVVIARELLGKTIRVSDGNNMCSGLIAETEAYAGVEDKASHAYGGRLTNRTKTMYLPGGYAYVYLCYGIHQLFNIVTNREGVPHAVLIRAAIPVEGIDVMCKRRNTADLTKLCSGPGNFSKAFGLTRSDNGIRLQQGRIDILDTELRHKRFQIISGPRVGIDYAEEHKDLPWRFRLEPA